MFQKCFAKMQNETRIRPPEHDIMQQIFNIDDAPLEIVGNGAKFVARFASLGAAMGARKLGVSLAVVPPGQRAFP